MHLSRQTVHGVRGSFCCFALLCGAVLISCSDIAPRDAAPTIITPIAIPDVLRNPGKGWVLYGKAEDQSPQALAIGSLGYHRFVWSEIEPAEGVYDWHRIDDALASWDRLGKQFAFGVMCASSHSKDPYVTPKWVFDAGANGRMLEMKSLANPYAGVPGVKAVPEFNDPIFMQKLEAFLTALGRRYDGDPRIAFIDIRSYGNWGEGHMYPFGGHELTPEEFHRHLQLHIASFRHTRLCVSAATKAHSAEYDWAASQGIAVRCDGICGNGDGSSVLRAFGHAPGVFEFFGSYTWMKEKGWWDGKPGGAYGHTLTDCVELGRPSYIGLSQGGPEALEFLAAEKPLIDHLANRMGYHIILERAAIPGTITTNADNMIDLTWRNNGTAPIYVDAAVAFALIDEAGKVADVAWPQQSNPSHWLPDSSCTERVSASFPHASLGRHQLSIGIVARHGDTRPIISLGIAGRTAAGWYPLTRVEVVRP